MDFINPVKTRYPVVIRVTTLIGVGLVISNFLLFPRFGNDIEFDSVEQVIIENIDIGGPTMVRSAAKNFKDVLIITSKNDYSDLVDELKKNIRRL